MRDLKPITDFDDLLAELMKNPEFEREYMRLKPIVEAEFRNAILQRERYIASLLERRGIRIKKKVWEE